MEIVAAAAARAATGGSVLHLEVGQPSDGAPPSAVAAAQARLAAGDPLGYTPACGLTPLRERIAALYRERYGVTVDPRRVVVTAGASGAMTLAFLAALDPGDRVIVTEPGYPCHREALTVLGAVPLPVRVGPEDGFLLRPDALTSVANVAATDASSIAAVVVARPANPTGTMYGENDLAGVAAWCRDAGALLIADEIYHGITFDRPAPTAFGDDVVVIGSFSKYFSMTGWRLGWMVVPDALVDPVDRLSQHLYLSPPTLAQHAALAAFDDTEVLDARVERYATNRSILLAGLERAGVGLVAPSDGAFYVYGEVSHFGTDSPTLARTWLDEIGVATTPGVDFDPTEGHRWMRWSVAGSTADVAEATERIVDWAERSRGGERT